ncbi:hypothetical protein ES703_103102 [subsurface metagenome]
MSRPLLWRRVNFIPPITYFRPAGVPLTTLQEVCLSVEEAEAIRLKDIEKLEQEECGQRMSVSRTTFARVLASAREKIADALLNGKAIRVEGGNFEMALRRFRCVNGHEWDVPFEVMIKSPPQFCPTCNTLSIMALWPWGPGWARGGGGRRRRGGRN